MTKADLIEEVSRLAELTRKDSEVIVETIFDSVVRSLRSGDKIEIRGFGSFRTRQRKPRVGRNPKTGEFKDTGNPARPMTPAERAYVQSMLDNMLSQFVKAVADGRKMKQEDIKAIADGKVWTGQEAVGLKLVDQIGGFEEAVTDTARAVGIKGVPTLVRPEKRQRSLLDLLLGDVSEWVPDKAKLMEQNPGFYYLWK